MARAASFFHPKRWPPRRRQAARSVFAHTVGASAAWRRQAAGAPIAAALVGQPCRAPDRRLCPRHGKQRELWREFQRHASSPPSFDASEGRRRLLPWAVPVPLPENILAVRAPSGRIISPAAPHQTLKWRRQEFPPAAAISPFSCPPKRRLNKQLPQTASSPPAPSPAHLQALRKFRLA